MRAILINPFTREISEIQVDGSLDSIAQAIGAKLLQINYEFPNFDVVHVDDDAPSKNLKSWFHITGTEKPYPGKALILGTTESGYDADAKSSLETIQSKIVFLSAIDVAAQWGVLDFQRIYQER